MQLGVVLDRFECTRGGAERYLFELAASLVARGHEVRVYCREGAAPAGVAIVRIAVRGLTRAARERSFAERACARARADGCAPLLGIRHAIDVDVYQPHGGAWAASAAARIEIDHRPWRRAVRGLLHRLSAKHRAFLAAERAIVSGGRALTLAVSEQVRIDLLTRCGGRGDRIVVVPPAIDVERLRGARRSPRGGGGATLLFMAHDFELKGLAHAIAAFARCEERRRGARLIVVGRAVPGRHAALARRLGVAAAIEFAGPALESSPWLARADVLIHPTYFDPCALICLEALAAGVPVVTTVRNGAAPYVVEAGGRVVDEPWDAAGLAAAVDSLVAEGAPAGRRAAAIGARFGWDAHLERLLPLLESGWREAGVEPASVADSGDPG